jgi:hypothetical protein
VANLDSHPASPAVFELLGINQFDQSYTAVCLSAPHGVVCHPGRLLPDAILERHAVREHAFSALALRLDALKNGPVGVASATPAQHELPLETPKPDARAALIADLGEGLHTSARRVGANALWLAINELSPGQWNSVLAAVVEYTILPLIKPDARDAPAVHPAPVEVSAQMLADVPIMRFFHYAHLPDALREISKPFAELALLLVSTLPASAERTAGLRKLLEAKDCAVRAALPVAGEPR